MSALLTGISKVYELGTFTRNWLYDSGILPSYEVRIPVISIGNITAGGNAKTPLCMYLVEELRKKNFSPVVLSRGYGGTEKGPYLVQSDDSPRKVGDEPLLISRNSNVPVVISRNRVNGAQFVYERQLGDVVILDDGFQHRRLRRVLDIVSVSLGSQEDLENFLSAEILPAGAFRESRDAALKRANVVILSERRPLAEKLQLDEDLFRVLPSHLQVYRSSLEPYDLVPLCGAGAVPRDGEVVAFCGIAGPDDFFATLEKMGFSLVDTIGYPDHHKFSQADLEELVEEFSGYPLICTEKDAVKLERLLVRSPVFVLRCRTKVSPQDAFIVQVQRALLDYAKTEEEPDVDMQRPAQGE